MIISLARLPADGLKFEHRYAAGELDLGHYDFELEQPPVVRGRVDQVGAEMRLRGSIEAGLKRPCDRCLKDVSLRVELPFDLFYTADDPGANRTGEIELHERDLDFAVYQNDEIDLDEMVLEQLELSLPTRVLCREDCRGLCPQCGVDWNQESCACTAPIDPRWQALEAMKEKFEKK